ncbi:MAG: hypothetical protein U1F58_05145 [Burkholderiales bacterium]
MTAPTPAPEPTATSADTLRKSIVARHAVRLHVALILAACFAVGLAVTKLLLEAGVHAMWLRYAVALVAGYGAFLLGVRIWLKYAGYDHPMLPGSRRSLARDAADALDGGWSGGSGGGGGSGSGGDLPVFRGGGGGSGGGGASARFGGLGFASGDATSPSTPGVSLKGGGGGFDLGDDGWVLVLLVALAAAAFGAVAWILYAAPTILADAAFAGMLSAGLVRPTRHIATGGWIASVVGHTWLAFAVVLVLAIAFAIVAQRHYPDAHTLVDVIRRL